LVLPLLLILHVVFLFVIVLIFAILVHSFYEELQLLVFSVCFLCPLLIFRIYLISFLFIFLDFFAIILFFFPIFLFSFTFFVNRVLLESKFFLLFRRGLKRNLLLKVMNHGYHYLSFHLNLIHNLDHYYLNPREHYPYLILIKFVVLFFFKFLLHFIIIDLHQNLHLSSKLMLYFNAFISIFYPF
jgi:hypothetical protein